MIMIRKKSAPHTFNNWLQAFCIYSSVWGERHPELCIIFMYKNLKFGTKDVGLWLNLLIPHKPTLPLLSPQPYQFKKDFCFSFNEGQCTFPNLCCCKHECATCFGNHPAFCFKKLHFNIGSHSKDNFRAGTHTGEVVRNVSVPPHLAIWRTCLLMVFPWLSFTSIFRTTL